MWLNVGYKDGLPFDDRFWVSFDGGLTWGHRPFPGRGLVGRGDLKQLGGPPMRDASRAVHRCQRGTVPGLHPNPDPLCDGNTDVHVFLETTDGGITWHRLGD